MESSAQAPRPAPEGVPPRLALAAGISWRVLVVLALVAVALFITWHLRVVAVPIFLAMLFSTLLLPLTDWLADHHVPRAVAVVLSVLLFLGVLSITTTLLVGSIIGEAGQIADLVSAGVGKVSDWSRSHNGPLSFDRAQVRSELGKLGPDLQSLGAGLLAKAAAEGSALLSTVVGFVMSLAFLIYLLADAAGIRAWVIRQGGEAHRAGVEQTMAEGWRTLSGYVRGTLIVAVFDAVFIGIGVVALGLPIPGTLIVLTFFAAFIPILGAWVAGLIVVLVALADQGLDAALIMVAVQVGVHTVESVWVAPMTYQRTVSLHPIATLAAVAAGGALMGVIGAVIAVPIVAFVWVTYSSLRRTWAQEEAPPPVSPEPA